MAAEPTDEELMLAYARGDVRAFQALYERHRGTVYRFVLRAVPERAQADDVFQETWSRLIAARVRYRPEAKFSTWLLQIAHNLVANTRLGDAAVRKQLWAGGAKAVAASSDPMIKFARAVDADARAVRKRFEDEIESIETRATELVAQALFAVQGTSIYPDATFSLRLTYGTVKGYRDAFGEVPAMTKLRGAFDRHTGREPFVLPQSWLLAKPRLKLDTPLNFVSTLDIIGGNSGSPALNKDGEVVGVLFDGNVQSLGCAFLYDDTANRAVAVHTGGLLEALRTIYGATALANEMAPPVAAKTQRLGQ